jgi:hypothetical protein
MPDREAPRPSSWRNRLWLGVILLATGLLGHLLAAAAEGGRAIHYQHHIVGFVLLTIGSAAIVAILGRLFWRGRHDTSLVILGALQTIFGLVILAMSNVR